MSNDRDYFLPLRQVRRNFDRAASSFDAHAGVHAEIRTRLIERLDLIRMAPATVLDLGAGTGHGTRALRDRFKQAHVIAADLSPGMLREAQRQQPFFRKFARIVGDAHQLPLAAGSIDLVFSNLMLQWSSTPDAVLSESRRVLREGGLLTFATLGPDSLRELRQAWSSIDDRVHVHAFIDMHDLGDALMRAGFAEPVMDTERLTVTYTSADRLLSELRATGSRNATSGHPPGLRARTVRTALLQRLHPDPQQPLAMTLEVVFGHAWVGKSRPKKQSPSEQLIPLANLTRSRTKQ